MSLRGLLFASILLLACGERAPAQAPKPASPAPVARDALRVRFVGNVHVPAQDLDPLVNIGRRGLPPEATAEDLLRADALRIEGAYFDRGFLKVQVEPPHVAMQDGDVQVTFVIHEGPRYRLMRLSFQAQGDDGAPSKLLEGVAAVHARIPLREGDWIARPPLVAAFRAIRDLYMEAGYGDVSVDPAMDLDDRLGLARFLVVVRSGPVLTIDDVELVGPKAVPEAELRQRIEVHAGERFKGSAVDRSIERLREHPRIAEAHVTIRQGVAPDRCILQFEVRERP